MRTAPRAGGQAGRWSYDVVMLQPPSSGDDWLGLTEEPLPVGAAADWAVLPSCGAIVLFSGTARDHAPGREGVELLDYEASALVGLPVDRVLTSASDHMMAEAARSIAGETALRSRTGRGRHRLDGQRHQFLRSR